MRSVEEVLRVVEDSEYYFEDSIGGDYMCISLVEAMEGGLIELGECSLAEKEIRDYLWDLGLDEDGSLELALYQNSLPDDFLARKAIYLDWNNRPKPWKGEECNMWVKLDDNNYFNIDNATEWVYHDRKHHWEFFNGACFDPSKTVSKEKFEIILRAMFREKY